jgi:hypothetical protein
VEQKLVRKMKLLDEKIMFGKRCIFEGRLLVQLQLQKRDGPHSNFCHKNAFQASFFMACLNFFPDQNYKGFQVRKTCPL